jgi:two-component system, OmpR family, sensor kinase
MRAIALARSRTIELAWFAFAAANLAAMAMWQRWETIPFHFIWVSLTLVYGFRVWRPLSTTTTLSFVAISTGVLILGDARAGTQEWGELFEVPLMSAMFLAMVWHARRRQDALGVAESHAVQLESLLERQERFLQDASHELRTPVTIARGHLEVRRRAAGGNGDGDSGEIDVALDELDRIERIIERLLLLARADQPGFVEQGEIELDHFLEDVFFRWTEVAPRRWRLGELASGTLSGDAEQLRIALDALLENAVKYSEPQDEIEISSARTAYGVTIEVRDAGIGIPQEALGRIFDRFARVDAARTRARGGVGLGLAIVDTIAKAHGGRAHVACRANGTVFSLDLPRFAQNGRAAPVAAQVHS